MKILFAISILSFLVLIGAVYAVVRHIRRSTPEAADPAITQLPAPPASKRTSPLRHSA